MQWIGESGKLVQRLFDNVKEKLANPSTFVVLIIGEVESLTSARKNASSGNESSVLLRTTKVWRRRTCGKRRTRHQD